MARELPTHGQRKKRKRTHPNMRERLLPSSEAYEDRRAQGDSGIAMAKRIRSSKRWQKKRRAILNTEPLCRPHKERGELVAATEVDHITPIQDAPELSFDDDNLQPICRACHAPKTVRELRDRRLANQRTDEGNDAR